MIRRSVRHLVVHLGPTWSQSRARCFLIATVACVGLYLILKTAQDELQLTSVTPEGYTAALAQHASRDRVILLALVDSAFVDMALNLYFSSLLPHHISNFLFVGAGERVCKILANHSLPCFHFASDPDSNEASRYLSESFLRKMNIRTEMILEALKSGYTVLHTDLDVVFIKNPLPELRKILSNADIALLQDTSVHNAGFLIVKPSARGIEVYSRTKSITDRSTSTDDQTALNTAISDMQNLDTEQDFRVDRLRPARYMCGWRYFEKEDRMFADDGACPSCMVVHNNWIVSQAAKIYRFKEHQMWMYDKDRYYTSSTQTYLIYDNPLDNWKDDLQATEAELNSLKAALAIGRMTGRVVILPRFHCGQTHLEGTSIKISRFNSRKRLYKHYTTNSRNATKFNYGSKEENVYNMSLIRAPVESVTNIRVGKIRKRSQNPTRQCPLNALLDMTAFDEEFAGQYRESSFLTHPLVHIPLTLFSNPQLILTSMAQRLLPSLVPNITLTVPNNRNKSFIDLFNSDTLEYFWSPSARDKNLTVTEKDIVERFGSVTTDRSNPNNKNPSPRVLVFNSLYFVNPVFTNATQGREFESKISRAFKRRAYRQY